MGYEFSRDELVGKPLTDAIQILQDEGWHWDASDEKRVDSKPLWSILAPTKPLVDSNKVRVDEYVTLYSELKNEQWVVIEAIEGAD